MSTEIMSLRDFTRDTPIRFDTAERPMEFSVNDVVQWIAPGAPHTEALKFLLTCRAARLNPLNGEIYLANMGGKWAVIVAKAGYLRRAQEHPQFLGFTAGIVVMAIDPKTNKGAGPMIELESGILPPGHLLLGGWCRCRKRGEEVPYYQQVSFADYRRDTPIWKSNPCTMIRKVAISSVLREAFNLSDSYDESELAPLPPRPAAQPPRDLGTVRATSVHPDRPALDPAPQAALDAPRPDYLARVHDLVNRTGMLPHQLANALASRGVGEIDELDRDQAVQFASKLESILSRAEFLDSFPGPAPEGAATLADGPSPVEVPEAPAVEIEAGDPVVMGGDGPATDAQAPAVEELATVG